MKVKDGGSRSGEMEEERRICKNCKRDVAVVNFSLHEAHCLRFLAVCPKCEELVASKDMKEHLTKAHQQVRCTLCHQTMQQYLLDRHEAEECQERSVKCHFCELELPFHKLQSHLDACGSRTTMCWDCGKYVMHKDQEGHKLTCQTGNRLRAPGSKTNLCQQCNNEFPADQYLRHLNECNSSPQLPGSPATHSAARSRSPPSPQTLPTPAPPSPTWKMKAEKDVRPKRRDRELPSLEKISLKSPRSKKAPGCQAFGSILTSAGPQAHNDMYDQLVTCSQCNILLPSPILQKHENECNSSPQLLGSPATHSAARSRSPPSPQTLPTPAPPSPTWKMKAEKDVRPKRVDRELPSLEKISLKSPRSKKAPGCQAFGSILTSAGSQAHNDIYDQLVTCSQCNILLPSPTLQKHEKKCQRAASLQAIRQNPRFLEKEGESVQSSQEGSSWQ